MRAANYELRHPTDASRFARLQSQRQEAKSQECLLKRLCRTNQGQSRRICPVSVSIGPHSRVDAKRVRKIGLGEQISKLQTRTSSVGTSPPRSRVIALSSPFLAALPLCAFKNRNPTALPRARQAT